MDKPTDLDALLVRVDSRIYQLKESMGVALGDPWPAVHAYLLALQEQNDSDAKRLFDEGYAIGYAAGLTS